MRRVKTCSKEENIKHACTIAQLQGQSLDQRFDGWFWDEGLGEGDRNTFLLREYLRKVLGRSRLLIRMLCLGLLIGKTSMAMQGPHQRS